MRHSTITGGEMVRTRINRVYTRKGDGGNTSLAGGSQIAKDHPRVHCYGLVDELNSILGIVRHFNGRLTQSPRTASMERILESIQQRLFDLGGELARGPDEKGGGPAGPGEAEVLWLEEVLDAMNDELPPLENFVLPGGGAVTSFLHQARTVCRSSERAAVTLARQEPVGKNVLPFLNRLSDLLFVAARWCAANQKEPELLWRQAGKPDDSWRW